jgi:hypothetical protein
MNNAMGTGVGGRCFVCLRLFAVRDILAGVYWWFMAVGILTCLHLVKVCVRSRGCDFCRALSLAQLEKPDVLLLDRRLQSHNAKSINK